MESRDETLARRRTLQTGVIHSAEEAEALERAFWAQLSGEQRVQAAWDLVSEYLAMGENSAATLRFDRTAAGVRRG